MRELQINEETLRDGQQSLWANRMKTESMLPVCSALDNAGFSSINIMSGSAFEACVLYLNEDPWERLRLLRKFMPKTDLQILIRGRSAFGWRRFSDDAIELLISCLQKCGIQGIVVFDGLNDLANIQWHIQVSKKLGLQIHPALVFAESPVHTDGYYAQKAAQCVALGTDSVNLADASGLLTPERIRTLVPAIRSAIGEKAKFGLVSHCGTGLGSECYLEAMRQGVDNLSTASLPLSQGNSIPATVEVLAEARTMGLKVDLNDRLLARIDDHFLWVAYSEKKPVGQRVPFDRARYKAYAAHQIPGGMMSHLASQLKGLGLESRLPEVLEEAGRVRQEIGYPVMVTPFSQIVGVQAVFNVLQKERYKTTPSDLALYARGFYGEKAAPIDPNVLDRILQGSDAEPIDATAVFSEPVVPAARKELGAALPDEKLLLSLFFSKPTLEKFNRNCRPIAIAPPPTPVRALIGELLKRPDIRKVAIRKGPLQLDQSF